MECMHIECKVKKEKSKYDEKVGLDMHLDRNVTTCSNV